MKVVNPNLLLEAVVAQLPFPLLDVDGMRAFLSDLEGFLFSVCQDRDSSNIVMGKWLANFIYTKLPSSMEFHTELCSAHGLWLAKSRSSEGRGGQKTLNSWSRFTHNSGRREKVARCIDAQVTEANVHVVKGPPGKEWCIWKDQVIESFFPMRDDGAPNPVLWRLNKQGQYKATKHQGTLLNILETVDVDHLQQRIANPTETFEPRFKHYCRPLVVAGGGRNGVKKRFVVCCNSIQDSVKKVRAALRGTPRTGRGPSAVRTGGCILTASAGVG